MWKRGTLLIFLAISLSSSQGIAGCRGLFGSLPFWGRTAKSDELPKSPTFEDYLVLAAKPVSSFFKDLERDDERDPLGVSFPDEEHAKFVAAFLKLTAAMTLYSENLYSRLRFEEWFKKEAPLLITPNNMREWLRPQPTMALKPFVHFMHHGYNIRHYRGSVGSRLYRAATNRYVIGAALGSAALWTVNFLKQLMILGPFVTITNSYLGSVVNPISQTAAQLGANNLVGIARLEETWMANAREMTMSYAELNRLVEAFEHLPPEEAKHQWEAIQRQHFEYYTRFNTAMPAHRRDGRNLARDLIWNQVIGMAAFVEVHRTAYKDARRDLEALEEKTRGRNLSPTEAARKAEYLADMEAAENRIAGTLAGWKLLQLTYQEFTTREPDVGSREAEALGNLNHIFLQGMRFDLFQKEYGSRMRAMLLEMGIKLGNVNKDIKDIQDLKLIKGKKK